MKNYSSEWITKFENNKHWNYYWYQLNMILSRVSPEDRLLEIGVGTGFLSNYLRSKNININTIDIDPEKKADITADITQYHFTEHFDHVIAFEVLEHIPYHDFERVLGKIHEICNKYLFLSIPRNEKVWLDIVVEFPGEKKFQFKLATIRNRIISKHHYWEMDYKEFTKKRIEQTFRYRGFEILSVQKYRTLYYYTLEKV